MLVDFECPNCKEDVSLMLEGFISDIARNIFTVVCEGCKYDISLEIEITRISIKSNG